MYNILIVDDEVLILNGLKNIIDWEQLDLNIQDTALNGEEALNKFIENPVDIVITDISMPKLNGLELIEKLKKLNSKVKFIILSGYDEFSYAKKAVSLGIENYILKPINEEELKSTLENTVSKLKAAASNLHLEEKRLEVLKENILYRWVTNSISGYELEEREFILDINLGYTYYIAGIISFDLKKESLERVYRYITKKTYRLANFSIFRDLENNIIIVLADNDCEALKNTSKSFLSSLIAELKKDINLDIFISVGSVEEEYKGLPVSYNVAKKLQDYILVHGYNRIIYAFDKDNEIKYDDLDISYIQDFKKLLLSKDLQQINQYIDNTFSRICTNPSRIQNTALRMLLTIRETYKELNITSLANNQDMKEMFLNIVTLKTLTEIKDLIKSESLKMTENIKNNSGGASPVIQQIISYINNYYQNEISIKTLSQKYKINPSYLGQIFHKEVGEQFSDYLTRIRNEKAKDMLLNTNLKINEIAQSVGYSDTSYFYRKFKEGLGVSPNVMRSSKNYKL